MSRARSPEPAPRRHGDMDVDNRSPVDKPDARVVIVTNLTRNVVESHLQVVFGFYGKITKIDLPLFGKSGQNRGKAALEFIDAPAAHKAAAHMNGGQLDGAILKVELSDLPIRSRSRSPRRPIRNGRDKLRSYSRSRTHSRSRSLSVTRSRSPPGPNYRRGVRDGPGPRDSYRGRPYGRRGGPPGRDFYRPGVNRSRSRSPVRRGAYDRPPPPRRRSPSYTRGGYGRGRRSRSRSRSYSVRSSRSRSRSYSRSRSRSRSRSMSYSSGSRYSRSRSRTRSVSRVRKSRSRDDIRDSRSRSPKI